MERGDGCPVMGGLAKQASTKRTGFGVVTKRVQGRSYAFAWMQWSLIAAIQRDPTKFGAASRRGNRRATALRSCNAERAVPNPTSYFKWTEFAADELHRLQQQRSLSLVAANQNGSKRKTCGCTLRKQCAACNVLTKLLANLLFEPSVGASIR